MKHRFFEEDMLDLISRPASWSLVSSAFPSDISPVENARHAAWMATHSHAHLHREIVMTLAGEGWQGFNSQAYPRRPGTVFYFKAFEPHDFFVPPWASEETQLWISLLPAHIIAWSFSIRPGGTITQPHWRHVFSREQIGNSDVALLNDDHASVLPPAVHRLHLQSFLGICLSLLLHAGCDLEETSLEPLSTQKEIIQAVQHHIEETAGCGVTIDQLAHLSGYSKYHLLRLFKQHTGRSVHAYINDCRMRRIIEMQMLRRSQKEIAAALGFSCPSSFAHWYKEYRQRGAAE